MITVKQLNKIKEQQKRLFDEKWVSARFAPKLKRKLTRLIFHDNVYAWNKLASFISEVNLLMYLLYDGFLLKLIFAGCKNVVR